MKIQKFRRKTNMRQDLSWKLLFVSISLFWFQYFFLCVNPNATLEFFLHYRFMQDCKFRATLILCFSYSHVLIIPRFKEGLSNFLKPFQFLSLFRIIYCSIFLSTYIVYVDIVYISMYRKKTIYLKNKVTYNLNDGVCNI